MKTYKIIHAKGRLKDRFYCGFPKALGGYYTRLRKNATCPDCKLNKKIGR